MRDPAPVLFFDDLSVAYGPATILHDVTATVTRGEVVAVLGANGSGKSTLMKAALGLAPVTRGEIYLFGEPISQPAKVPFDRIGYVPQRAAAIGETPTTALEVVMSGLIGNWRLRPRRGAKATAMEALTKVNLADRAHDPIRVFSGGQIQRTLIARALVRRPELIVLDEPLAGIDRHSQELLLNALHELHDEGTTIIVVLHELGPFEGFLDRSIVLAQGSIAHDGAPPEPHGHHAHPDHVHQHHPHGDNAPPALAPDLSWG